MISSLKILLVDDEPLILDLLTETLVDRGHHVTAVPNSRSAIAAVAAESFDIAFLDNYLGATRGIDLLRELAKRDPEISLVMMTGGANQVVVAEAMHAGAVACLSKPVFEKDLAICIAGVVAARGGRRGAARV